jgi:hypothetical protein
MERPMTRISLAAGVLLTMAAGTALASSKAPLFNVPNNAIGAITTPLGCRIENVKEIVITNTTAGTIAAGTAITYDALRYRSTLHYGGTVSAPRMLPGTQIRLGGQDSASCTAWFRPQPLLSQ